MASEMSPESTGNPAFAKAANDLQKLARKPGDKDLLKFYALFKQSIFGDNTIPKPSMLDFKGGAKWQAWTDKKGVSKEDAQSEYIKLVDEFKNKP